MPKVIKSNQLKSDNHAYLELSRDTLSHQLKVLFPATGLISLVIAFTYFVSESATNSTNFTTAVIAALLSFFLSAANKSNVNPYLLIWIFILYTTAVCAYDLINDTAQLISNTIALTIPLLCFFALKHQHAWWYSFLFGLFYIVMSSGEVMSKELQITETLRNISAYAMVLVMAYLLAQHRNEAIERVQKTATTDFLTALHNRQGLEAVYQHEAYRSNRYLKDLTLLLIDIDDLKAINDRYGLEVGDQALMMLSKCLREQTQQADHIARIGAEEFCILLPNTDIKQAEAFASKLNETISNWQLELDSGHRITLSISIGITQVEFQNFSLDYIKADSALQRAKNWGQGQIVIG
ncbi:GGDEF domain-containing protein [Photobacterium sanctipauli]|uniref:diguanylate cyclase n=2 Tax=Photobacterium sanctipauli TaxID=1342794 RepID=A0A2T3NVI7_9GAMM|nr:GGDEF domain-containing protein [Photobacterium sanctipauli]PSW20290.1 GGDEF domain-containing protein [Photobacterium sanctipauli]